jgi:hypothetical protein
MRPFLNKLIRRIVKDRIKPFVIIQFILLIAYFIVASYALKGGETNYFYLGMCQIILALCVFLLGIEHILLNKKMSSVFMFILTFVWIYLAIQSFGLLNIKR